MEKQLGIALSGALAQAGTSLLVTEWWVSTSKACTLLGAGCSMNAGEVKYDVLATLINMGGAAMLGLLKGVARRDGERRGRRSAAGGDRADWAFFADIVQNGFLGVMTSTVFVAAHAAHLAVSSGSPAVGAAFILISFLGGAFCYGLGHMLGVMCSDWISKLASALFPSATRGHFLSAMYLVVFAGFLKLKLRLKVTRGEGGGWSVGRDADFDYTGGIYSQWGGQESFYPDLQLSNEEVEYLWSMFMALTGLLLGNWFEALEGGGVGERQQGSSSSSRSSSNSNSDGNGVEEEEAAAAQPTRV